MVKSKKGYINIIQEINKRLQEKRKECGRFWYCYHEQNNTDLPGIDLNYSKEIEIDLTETSYNLDFRISTYQSRSENVYFFISLWDYDTKKEIPAGHYYIKNNTGIIGKLEAVALLDIIQAGTDLTNKIYWDH